MGSILWYGDDRQLFPVRGRLSLFLLAWQKLTSDQFILEVVWQGYSLLCLHCVFHVGPSSQVTSVWRMVATARGRGGGGGVSVGPLSWLAGLGFALGVLFPARFGLVLLGPVPHFFLCWIWEWLLPFAGSQGRQLSRSGTLSAVPSFPWTLFFSQVRKQLPQEWMEAPYPASISTAWDSAELWFQTELGNEFDKFAWIYIFLLRFQTIMNSWLVGLPPPPSMVFNLGIGVSVWFCWRLNWEWMEMLASAYCV